MIFFLLCWSVLAPLASASDTLAQIAKKSLETNIIKLPLGDYLSAGGTQFRTLWTRDFSWASRGLFAIGRPEIVRTQIDRLILEMREDGLVPKTLDSMSPQKRVLLASLDWFRGRIPVPLPLEEPLIPYFKDENSSEAIDSNLLVLKTALELKERFPEFEPWWNSHRSDWKKVYSYYRKKKNSKGLILQPPHSDWQDSVQRVGASFYVNFLHSWVTERLAQDPFFEIRPESAQKLKHTVHQVFWDPKVSLYRSMAEGPWFSLEGQLMALESAWQGEALAHRHYQALKKSEFFTRSGIPGFNTFPDYPEEWRSDAVNTAGLGNYHDRVYWSWLMAYSGKIAVQYGDRAMGSVILKNIERLAQRDQSIVEIYFDTFPAQQPWQSRFYRSERPFSWGSAFILDFLLAVKAAQ